MCKWNVDTEEKFSTKHMATVWRQEYCSLLVWRFYLVPVKKRTFNLWAHVKALLPILCWTCISSSIRINKIYSPQEIKRRGFVYLGKSEYRGPFVSYDFYKLNTYIYSCIWEKPCLWDEIVIILLLTLFFDVSQPFKLLFNRNSYTILSLVFRWPVK